MHKLASIKTMTTFNSDLFNTQCNSSTICSDFDSLHYQTVGHKQFLNEKKQSLGKLDKSVAGRIDGPIAHLVEMINKSDHYYTTSSCSGRIIVTAVDNQDVTIKKNGLHWSFVSHEPIDDYDDFTRQILSNASGDNHQYESMTMKFEPVILHVRARNIETARQLLQVCLGAGLRNSGMVLSCPGGATKQQRATVAIRSTTLMEVPLVIDGVLAVDGHYLAQLVKVANRKMHSNRQTIEKLQLALKVLFCGGARTL